MKSRKPVWRHSGSKEQEIAVLARELLPALLSTRFVWSNGFVDSRGRLIEEVVEVESAKRVGVAFKAAEAFLAHKSKYLRAAKARKAERSMRRALKETAGRLTKLRRRA